MRVKKDYYLRFAKEIKEFCNSLEDKEYLILKSLALSKEFKRHKRLKDIYKDIPSLFSEEELNAG